MKHTALRAVIPRNSLLKLLFQIQAQRLLEDQQVIDAVGVEVARA